MMKPGEGKEKVERVPLGSIFPSDKIVKFLLKRGKEEKLFVTDENGDNPVELVLNGSGALCFLVGGNNKRLVSESGREFYMDVESVDRINQVHEVDYMSPFKEEIHNGEDKDVKDPFTEAAQAVFRAILKCGTIEPEVVRKPDAPKPVTQEVVSVAPSDRLSKVLALIAKTNGKYTIWRNHSKKGYTIRSEDTGGSSRIVKLLEGHGCEVKLSQVYLDVILNFSHEEERIAKAAGYKLTVRY